MVRPIFHILYFFKPNFDIDTFLTRYKREYGLERLNNDLCVYLRVLKSSMSELINKEYADFVNLSTNLVRKSRLQTVILFVH